jgi:hypothetical protein
MVLSNARGWFSKRTPAVAHGDWLTGVFGPGELINGHLRLHVMPAYNVLFDDVLHVFWPMQWLDELIVVADMTTITVRCHWNGVHFV